MYKLITFGTQEEPRQTLMRIADNTSIPFDPANTDYIEYLKWLEAGNTPLPADEPTA